MAEDVFVAQTPEGPIAGHVGGSDALLAAGFSDKLGGVRAAAVLVLGEVSPLPVSQGQQVAALLPSAEVNVIPGAGHLTWYEQPGCVAAALAAQGGLAERGIRSGPSSPGANCRPGGRRTPHRGSRPRASPGP